MDEKVLQELQTELKGFIARKDDELKTLGAASTETKSAIELLVSAFSSQQSVDSLVRINIQKNNKF